MLAKGEAFFALGLLTMQAVPDYTPTKPKMYPIPAVITISVIAASRSNGLTK